MDYIHIRLVCGVAAELLFIIMPFIAAFRKELKFSAAGITGILAGYLFFVCLITAAWIPYTRGQMYLPWLFLSMAGNVLLCKWLSKTSWKVVTYTLFLFKNFEDIAVLCARLLNAKLLNVSWHSTSHLFGTEMAYRLLFLTVIVWGAYFLLHGYLLEAVKYTRPLPIWNRLVTIPILFFFVYHIDIGRLPPYQFLAEHPHAIISVPGWLGCIYMVHYVSLRILTRLAQSYAIQEQYRTTRLLASVQTSQMAALQYNLDQLKKTRHDCRHHLITLKGLLDQEKYVRAREYINEYLGSFESLSMVHYCSHISSNAILNYYISQAKDKGIDVESSISLPSSLPLPDIDFCTILGNLLSNAVESCMRQTSPPSFITINIGMAGQSMVALSIRNTYTHDIRLKDGRFISSKRDDLGTGTSSVQYLVERYHGIINYTYKEGIFDTSLLLNPLIK